jgi:hypothetical protein
MAEKHTVSYNIHTSPSTPITLAPYFWVNYKVKIYYRFNLNMYSLYVQCTQHSTIQPITIEELSHSMLSVNHRILSGWCVKCILFEN